MSTSSTDTIAVAETTSILNINMGNVTKLTATNYLMWHRHVHALLDGYGLAGYYDGTVIAPDSTITTNGAVSANPAFVSWTRQDKLIYSALLGTISVNVQPILSNAVTSAKISSKLSSTYANRRRGHVKQLRTQLDNWKKDTKTIDEYVQGINTV